jgi:predicted RNase H-like nuclease (RuvC/YqgF family)
MKNRLILRGGRLASRGWSFFSFQMLMLASVFLSVGIFSSLRAADTNVRLANLTQDLELISRQVANLRSEVEILRRENAQLRIVAEKAGKTQGASSSSLQEFARQMDGRLEGLRLDISKNKTGAEALRRHVDAGLQRLIKQMNAGFDSYSGTPLPVAPKPPIKFSDDYPKGKGLVHVIGKGDTISNIAEKYKSKTKWIISANQISDPTKVQIGKQLYVPQS